MCGVLTITLSAGAMTPAAYVGHDNWDFDTICRDDGPGWHVFAGTMVHRQCLHRLGNKKHAIKRKILGIPRAPVSTPLPPLFFL